MEKFAVTSIIGVVGGALSTAFGGWDSALTTLVIFMIADYISGLVCAGVFKKSEKTETGALESRAGFKGLCRKGMMMLIVLVAHRLDLAIGSDFVKNATVIALIANETISIVENAGLMGLKLPPVITKAIDILNAKSRQEEQKGDDVNENV